MTETHDVVIVGAGHNGLVCAAYLARARRRVLVLEAADDVGGGAVTREFAPEFRVSSCAHLLFMLHPKIMADFDLVHGVSAVAWKALNTMSLGANGEHVMLGRERVSGTSVSGKDADAYASFKSRLRDYAKVLAPLMTKAPPRLVNSKLANSWALAKVGLDLRFGLGKAPFRDFLRIAGINIFDLLNEEFDHDLIKGALSLDAVLGTNMGPRTPGTVLSYLYRLTGELDGGIGGPAVPLGGMGALTRALAERARDYGAEIRVNAPVDRIVVDGARATAVETQGETIHARTIISNADPKTTFLGLVGASHLDAFFAHRVGNIRMKGTAAKLHLALDGVPNFTGLNAAAMGNRLIIAPSMEYVERAFDAAKYGGYSRQPAIEITLPSLHDSSLAPEGKHILSAVVQYAPYALKDGWKAARETFADAVIDRIAEFAPDLKRQILHRELLTPVDIEHEFRMNGGHWHHGEFAIDQLLMMRPVYGAAQYATPIDGLYLCGAGSHPGGGIMGAPGHNAARAVLARES